MLSRLHRTTAVVATVTTLVMALSSLVPTSVFAQNFAFRSKDPVGSLPAFVDMLKAKHSDLYNSIYSLPTKAGSAARAAITETTSKLFGVFHAASTHDSFPGVHDAFLLAVMLFIWSSEGAPMSNEMYHLLLQYLATPLANMPSLLAQCQDSYILRDGHTRRPHRHVPSHRSTVHPWLEAPRHQHGSRLLHGTLADAVGMCNIADLPPNQGYLPR